MFDYESCQTNKSPPSLMWRLQAVGPQEVIPRPFQMLGDQRLRGVGIALVQRVVDAPMLTVVVNDDVRGQDLLLHRVPLPVESHLIDLPVNTEQERVP